MIGVRSALHEGAAGNVDGNASRFVEALFYGYLPRSWARGGT